MDNYYQMDIYPKSNAECLIPGQKYRISILTNRMIRLEYSENGAFVDCASQTVMNRNFIVPEFQVVETEEQLDISTEYLQITYDKQRFSSGGLSIRLKQYTYSNHSIWHFGEHGENLKGTARTLDDTDGSIPLEDGILSRIGYSVIDDSKSLLLTEDGWVQPPFKDHTDIYFLGYGHSYLDCLNDFYHLCGRTPLLPRYALGNWWSRFYPYTQDEYSDLMNRFKQEGLPFSVAVFDMDWHYVKLDKKYGNGWTGYTWNKELFPNHKKLLKNLQKRGMHITLNVHPADGVRGHESAYASMAKALGVDYENEAPISFDIASPNFLNAYFNYLHHPLENEGVDFWWIDWQQGKTTKLPGLDPLWMLNHYHYLDNGRNGKRALVFSRYAGIGSHRYPIGFSGDTIITWKALEFQPYFTATASNVGYGWWSHDIGGHMNGYRDDELATRWLQFGTFSPIMRLHSSGSVFTGKEPWKFGTEARQVMNCFLRLRHKLIPYLYTMNARFHFENQPLIQPMYYQYPDTDEAYEIPNQYLFGSELMVNPITAKMDVKIRAGRVKTWLPEGVWFDFFSGLIYKGNRSIIMYRTIETIPVLAKAGSIIPMQKEETVNSHTENPKDMELCVFAGSSGEFTMYEDDGLSMDYESKKYALTKYVLSWDDTKCFTVNPAEGDMSSLPKKRSYDIKIFGLPENSVKCVLINGKITEGSLSYDTEKNLQIVSLKEISIDDKLEIHINPSTELTGNKILQRVYEALNRAQIEYQMKEKIFGIAESAVSMKSMISSLNALEVCPQIKELVQEIILA